MMAVNKQDMPQSWPVGVDTEQEAGLRQQFGSEGFVPIVVDAFQRVVYGYASEHRRELPWRGAEDPYRVLVSEVMLQQTQVDRVLPKYLAFVQRFPDPQTLAEAPVPELLTAWQGLGYNRRALNLQRAARMVVEQWGGSIPDDPVLLRQLPGIGPYTAGAISTFAFSRPNLFLETNIRAVLLHFFFVAQEGVTDKQLLPVAETVLDSSNPRDWYNALMDYGSDLKRRFPNPSRRSRHHTVQSRFEGSDRQIRGAVLRLLLRGGGSTAAGLLQQLNCTDERLQCLLTALVQEGLLQKKGRQFLIAGQ